MVGDTFSKISYTPLVIVISPGELVSVSGTIPTLFRKTKVQFKENDLVVKVSVETTAIQQSVTRKIPERR